MPEMLEADLSNWSNLESEKPEVWCPQEEEEKTEPENSLLAPLKVGAREAALLLLLADELNLLISIW